MSKKRIYYVIFIIAILLFSCNTGTKQKSKNKKTTYKYLIKGYIPNGDGETISLLDSAENLIQQEVIKDGRFEFSGTPEVTTAFLLFENGEKTPIFLDTLIYKVRTWDNNNKRLFVESSNPKQFVYNIYQRKLANLDRAILNAYQENNEGGIVQLREKKRNLIEQFINKNKSKFVGLFELDCQKQYFSEEQNSDLFISLDDNLKNSCMGVDLGIEIERKLARETSVNKGIEKEKTIKTIKNTTKQQPKVKKAPERIPAPSFSGLNPDGHLIDLGTVVSQNKIIMLDFWASWCQPCRMQNPFWIRLYRKYHAKGFEIISIAEETEESRPFLEGAIKDDGMSWKHIIDQNYEIAEKYGAYSLPHAVLIDKKGQLIYHKATARDVQEFLADFFDK